MKPKLSPPKSRAIIRLYALQRLLMWHALSVRLPLYLVAEFPKSGGTWFSQMLADYLGLPFARNTLRPSMRSSVLHGHHLYNSRFHNVFCVIRDGRDVTISAYYHWLFENEWNNPSFVRDNRRYLGFSDFDNIRENLPRFIEFFFVEHHKASLHFNWATFIDSWDRRDVPIIKYEDLLASPLETVANSIHQVTQQEINEERLSVAIEKFSFRNVAKRTQGDERKSSFVRKGVAGDWVNHFSRDAKKIFSEVAGEQLILCGYEPSFDWVNGGSSVVHP